MCISTLFELLYELRYRTNDHQSDNGGSKEREDYN